MFRFETTGVATFLLVMRAGFLVFFTTTEPGFDVAFYWIFVVFGREGSARMSFPCLSEIADERKCSLSACFEGRFILTPPPGAVASWVPSFIARAETGACVFF